MKEPNTGLAYLCDSPGFQRKSRVTVSFFNTGRARSEKTWVCCVWTAKAQISLRIRTVWSAHLLFAFWKLNLRPAIRKSKPAKKRAPSAGSEIPEKSTKSYYRLYSVRNHEPHHECTANTLIWRGHMSGMVVWLSLATQVVWWICQELANALGSSW